MSDMGGAHPREDDHRDGRITDRLVRSRKSLVVGDTERELCDGVRRSRRHHAARELRMWALLGWLSRAIPHREAGGPLDPRPLVAVGQPPTRGRSESDGNPPPTTQGRLDKALTDGAQATGSARHETDDVAMAHHAASRQLRR
jgi:hypothetical protein